MGTSRNKIAAIAALSTIWPGMALPQQTGTGGTAARGAGGLQFDINVNSKLSYDDNFQLQPRSPGSTTIFDNSVDLNLSSVTSVQDFNVNASGVFRYAEIPGRSISGFEDPTIRLGYRLDGVNSRLTFNGRYRNVDREFLDPFQVEQEEQQSNIFVDDGGTVEFTTAALSYQTGLNDPLGFTVSLDHDQRDYSNVTNARLFDRETNSANLTATLKVSPVTQLRAQAGITEFSADDAVGTERRTTDYSIGVVQDIDPTLVLDARLGRTEIDTDTNTGSSNRSGATGAATLTKTLSNGTVFASIDSTVNQNGSRNSLRFGRSLQLPSGSFNASVGGIDTPSGNNYVIGSLGYTHQLKTSNINVSINRNVSTNSLSEDVLDTRVSVGYGYEINNNSRLNVALNWGRSESAGIGGAPTVERTSLRATYSHALTQDWDLTGGVLVRRRSASTATGDAQSNSVFVTLDRSFNFRP
ncbi:hypothetical protein DEA8626_03143 [Defluviimonas aquaemixtae]|uniref:TIGR03016 family PEP-CTERM system-associated outer membrane protein n=1 Tax=Albidovulum aquaemixtae TaxID=1542388 RepID=A0A2R8BL65_9RHOB|nr:hypothetical protein [Defluviimonas aquaemixtae]SPH24094.1 hypothetical protein DEA8626_03143 [Defluviimonas aquaemixtae]